MTDLKIEKPEAPTEIHVDTSRLVRAVHHVNPAEAQPANWHLVPVDDSDDIIATNTQTGRVFQGAMADFNALLRG